HAGDGVILNRTGSLNPVVDVCRNFLIPNRIFFFACTICARGGHLVSYERRQVLRRFKCDSRTENYNKRHAIETAAKRTWSSKIRSEARAKIWGLQISFAAFSRASSGTVHWLPSKFPTRSPKLNW